MDEYDEDDKDVAESDSHLTTQSQSFFEDVQKYEALLLYKQGLKHPDEIF